MTVDKMHLFSEKVSSLVSRIDDRKIEIEGLQEGLQLIKEQCEKAYIDRKTIIYNAIPFLKKVAQCYEKREITESQRDELFQNRQNDLAPLNKRIQEYEETINLLKQRINVLNDKIQKTGEKIHVLMASHRAETAQLKTETAEYIFSYTRFSPSLFQAPPPAKGTKAPATVKEAFEQYISSPAMGQSKGS